MSIINLIISGGVFFFFYQDFSSCGWQKSETTIKPVRERDEYNIKHTVGFTGDTEINVVFCTDGTPGEREERDPIVVTATLEAVRTTQAAVEEKYGVSKSELLSSLKLEEPVFEELVSFE